MLELKLRQIKMKIIAISIFCEKANGMNARIEMSPETRIKSRFFFVLSAALESSNGMKIAAASPTASIKPTAEYENPLFLKRI